MGRDDEERSDASETLGEEFWSAWGLLVVICRLGYTRRPNWYLAWQTFAQMDP